MKHSLNKYYVLIPNFKLKSLRTLFTILTLSSSLFIMKTETMAMPDCCIKYGRKFLSFQASITMQFEEDNWKLIV